MNDIERKSKKRKRINDRDFLIVEENEYLLLKENNYNVKQLIEMCKYYKLKTTGNKNNINERIYEFLKKNYKIKKIQKHIKGYITRKYIKLHGEGAINKKMCVNETDFSNLDNLDSINFTQLFTYKDKIDNQYYGFHINSLATLINKSDKSDNNKNNIYNPYTRNIIPVQELQNFITLLRLSKILNINIENNNDDFSNITKDQLFKLKVTKLFQTIDELGNYTDTDWFLKLNQYELMKFISELMDVWVYRANINLEEKRKILPPDANLQTYIGIPLELLHTLSFKKLQKLSYKIIKKLVTKGIDKSSKNLGAIFVLGTLTIINKDAAGSLPWLYESFSLNMNNLF
jgi:hypothetical protein